MKIVKLSLILVAAVAAIIGLSTASYAFHSGGVAECLGCHNIHDAVSASNLMVGPDITSTCANASCHGSQSAGSYHILTLAANQPVGTPPLNKTPGGDFGWLLKTFTFSPRSGTTETSPGESHGHNVVAPTLGYSADSVNTTPPGGGTMDAGELSCNSCHDNHGKLRRLNSGAIATTGAPIIGSGSYTNSVSPAAGQAVGMYRLLRGNGSTAGSGGTTFSANFNAVVASSYNQSEGTNGPTAMAYGSGVSDWCATCHPDMLSSGSGLHTHPTNQAMSSTVVGNYNSYVSSGITGNPNFDTIVPYQTDNTTSLATLQSAATTSTRDATTSDRVMCLSCHRAHASAFTHMTRWSQEPEFMSADAVFPGTDATGVNSQGKYAQGRSVAENAAAWNRKATDTYPYGAYQRSLCNKCHAKD
jgi:hypothetical protein